ncbi:MAG: ribonuclease III [Fibrobacter sp.]|uniref:ribonuclease III n=1 Tax=Fibrobacter sp. TaxID=35828 RepID=UPI002A916506|nr:ribonuclease III [Fibrobacter sp.]MDY6264842.1 ribonuclease III [Fibrobacter sp.]
MLKLWFRQKSDGGLEAKLGYRFKDPELLAHALVHRSFLTGTDLPYVSNNERLEFLGDSVLNMLTTEFLYKTYPDDPEGELSKRKSAIVSGHACAQSSKEWSLSEYVKVGKAEEKLGGRGKESILADAYEAVLGAVYLDGGLEEVRAILNKFHFPRVQEIISAEDFANHKSELLEYLQGKLRTVPEYIVVDESGPEHQKVFTVEVHVDGRVYGRGQGGNKKKAEQEASRVSLEMLLAEAAKAEADGSASSPTDKAAAPKPKKQRHVGLP